MNEASKIRIKAARVFFPAAALYAALAVPLAVYAMTAGAAWPPGLSGPAHAHEMLFGFVLALVAGYLLGSISIRTLALLLGLWLAARVSYTLAPDSLTAAVLSPLYALLLAACVVPKFRHAGKWRNRSVMPLLSALCLLPLAYVAAAHYSWQVTKHELLLAGIILLALLMAFMGGRVIAPAVAGGFYRIGVNLKERVQPRLEGALIILLAIATAAVFLPPARCIAGGAALAGGLVAAVRLYRWRIWRLRGRPDLWCLGIGYGWLALGLVLLGGLLLADAYPVPAVHVITVGALGTLSTCVMTRFHFQRTKEHPARARMVTVSVGLIGVAALSRFGVDMIAGQREPLLWLSAACWSAAYLLTAARLLTGHGRQPA